jgi:hypothetical protein
MKTHCTAIVKELRNWLGLWLLELAAYISADRQQVLIYQGSYLITKALVDGRDRLDTVVWKDREVSL